MDKLTRIPGADADATLALLGGLNSQTDGVELAYQALDLVVARYRLADAHLVLRPGSLSPQVFVHGRQHVAPERAGDLAERPSGLYADPDVVPMIVQDALTGCCEMALAAHAARRDAAGGTAGLSSRRVIEDAVRRAASRSARFRWHFSLVLVTTTGTGSPGVRWQALATSLRAAVRVCDEVGSVGAGHAMAILPNTGSEDVEPFVERVRASLVAQAGDQEVRLVVGAATAPGDSVDPEQLWRLCRLRLAGRSPGDPDPDGPAWRRRPPSASEVELELRCLPDVVSVGTTGLTDPDARVRSVTVVARHHDDELQQAANRIAGEHLGDVPVAVLDAGGRSVPALGTLPEAVDGAAGARAGGAAPTTANGAAPTTANGAAPTTANGAWRSSTPPALERGSGADVAAGTDAGRSEERRRDNLAGAPRVVLLLSEFDPSTGASEVSLSWRGLKAVGRATGTPLTGAAQATLTAVEALGAHVPYFLTAVDRVTARPGAPVVVALAERHGEDRAGSGRRVGVAAGADEVEASSRATLCALNRLLSKAQSVR